MSTVRSLHPRALRVAALAALLGAAPAFASFDYADTAVGSSDLSPHHFVLDANGAWVHGLATARYAANGTLVGLSEGDALDVLMAETIDGGFVAASAPSLDPDSVVVCNLAKHGQWSRTIDFGAQCDSVSADGNGTIWATTRATIATEAVSVYAIGTDGAGLEGPIALPDHFVALAIAPAKASGAYVAGYDSAASHPSVVALDASGAGSWQATDATGDGKFTQVAIDTTGNVRLAGQASDRTLVAAGYDATGHAIGVTRTPIAGPDRTSGIAIAADGSTFNYALGLDGAHRVLQRIAPNEAPTGEVSLPAGSPGSYSSQVDGHAGIRIAANGDVLVLTDTGNGTTPAASVSLLRFNGAGFLVSATPIAADAGATAIYVSSMATLADSSALLTVYSGGLPTDPSMHIAPPGKFVHVNTQGAIVASPFATANLVPASQSNAVALIADDGTSYLETTNKFGAIDPATFDYSESVVSLSAIAPDGTRLWKLTPGVSGKLAANDDFVCILGSNDAGTVVECRNANDGSVASTTALQPIASTAEGLNFADDGTLVAVYASLDSNGGTSNGVQVSTVDTSGHLLSTNNVHVNASFFATCDDGGFALVGGDGDVSATRIAPDGSVAWTTALPTPGAQALGAQCLDDGSVAVEGPLGDATFGVSLFSPSGTVAWSKVLINGFDATSFGFQSAVADDTGLYVTSIATPPGELGAPSIGSTVTRLDRATGETEWTRDFQPAAQNGIAIDPATGLAIYYATSDTRVTLLPLLPMGALGTMSVRSCDCDFPVPVVAARVTGDGTLIYVLGSYGNGFDAPHVVGIDDVIAVPETDIQPSQSGIWYAPYTSGQGFGIDISPLNTIFATWFTFAAEGDDGPTPRVNDPSTQNWYSLQGMVLPDDAATAVLSIYSNTGGTFASGSTSADPVGNATLRFVDCNHAKLQYRPETSAGPGPDLVPTIDLVRLTAQVGDCTNADGTVDHGIAAVAANGFDTNQSGSWYDTSTGGQGLDLSITPHASGLAGLVFGAWYTYDPAGAADDPTSQHWFTLQADLSTATNGSVVVPIYSTLGGIFDEIPANTTVRVGQGTLTFDGCSSGTFAYQFDTTEMAGAYRGLSGTLNLTPLTACQE